MTDTRYFCPVPILIHRYPYQMLRDDTSSCAMQNIRAGVKDAPCDFSVLDS